jgi:hypothetical protein
VAGNQTATTALRIGGGTSNAQSWVGRIDDAKVFNRVLTTEEIALAAEPLEVPRSPLVSPGGVQETRVDTSVSLNGAVDSATPASVLWSWTGNGTAIFDSTTQPQTNVTFAAAGPKVLRLTANDGSVVVFAETLVSVLAAPTGFESWINSHPGLVDKGPSADPDGDRIPNLIEYALGGNPLQANLQELPRQSMTRVSGLDYLTLSVDRNAAASDLTFSVEVSSDLQTWYSGDAYTTILSAPGDAVFTARDNTPVGSGNLRRFIRLKISKP